MMSASAAPTVPDVMSCVFIALYGMPMSSRMPLISEDGTVWRMKASTSSQRRAVSSMRVPVGARRCRMNWPLSTAGKEVLAEPRQKQEGDQADREKAGNKNDAGTDEARQHSFVGITNALKSAVEAMLESGEDSRRCACDVL